MPDCTPVWATSDAWWQLFQHHDLCTFASLVAHTGVD